MADQRARTNFVLSRERSFVRPPSQFQQYLYAQPVSQPIQETGFNFFLTGKKDFTETQIPTCGPQGGKPGKADHGALPATQQPCGWNKRCEIKRTRQRIHDELPRAPSFTVPTYI